MGVTKVEANRFRNWLWGIDRGVTLSVVASLSVPALYLGSTYGPLSVSIFSVVPYIKRVFSSQVELSTLDCHFAIQKMERTKGLLISIASLKALNPSDCNIGLSSLVKIDNKMSDMMIAALVPTHLHYIKESFLIKVLQLNIQKPNFSGLQSLTC